MPSLNDNDLWTLARDKRVKQRVIAAQTIDAPEAVLAHLVNDSSPAVRRVLAARDDLRTRATLQLLAHDSDLKTRQALVANPACPAEILLKLVNDPHWSVRWSLPSHPEVNSVVRQAICQSSDDDLRRLQAEQADLDHETALVLLSDTSATVRAALAAHTTYPDILGVLLQEQSEEVRAGAAQNRLTTSEQRHVLARDRSALVRANLLKFVELEEEDLRLLAVDRSVNVRWWLATWPDTPTSILHILAQDSNAEVASQAVAALQAR
ncbi:hypothetical protein [Nonomuraea sp. NPDC050202]|jgi:hypothetical protein|uniref:hypothetical protein n=1 Tax=Nonomuraea sp. NPDC050202 TaxID=3155035 RepID=UPI0033F1118C